ncbi:MAG: mismatch endonuclease vsr [Frankiales bacterium]|nr:mismatch endonuclease vsr [Frankiales bacterium]
MPLVPVVLPPAPPASSENVRRVLSRTGRRDTAPELALRRALFALGLRFLVDVPAPGCGRRRRVDVLLRGARIAVLVHGCFWHSCPQHFHAPKANAEWWRLKLASIRERDADTLLRLAEAGWLPVVVWECHDMTVAAAELAALSRRRRQDLQGQQRRP